MPIGWPWCVEVRALEKVSVSTREIGRDVELCIHSSIQQIFPGVF